MEYVKQVLIFCATFMWVVGCSLLDIRESPIGFIVTGAFMSRKSIANLSDLAASAFCNWVYYSELHNPSPLTEILYGWKLLKGENLPRQ
jgi:hypothetical protein